MKRVACLLAVCTMAVLSSACPKPDCESNKDCDKGFCCQGECKTVDDLDSFCGCEAPVDGEAGTKCSGKSPVVTCLVAGKSATVDNADEGTCSCNCTVDQGGPLCTVNESGPVVVTCGCDRSDNLGCEIPVTDAAGAKHKIADTCGTTNECICLANNLEACSGGDDCCGNGCKNLSTDPANCGACAHACGQGEDCVAGACTCKSDSHDDCRLTGGTRDNPGGSTNICESKNCVCAEFLDSAEKSHACPLGSYCCDSGDVRGCCERACNESDNNCVRTTL